MIRKRLVLAMALIPALVAALSAAEQNKTAAPAAQPAPSANQAAMSPNASADKVTLARPTASVELMTEPSKVWKKLVSPEGMTAFGVTAEKKKSLEKVGDNVRANFSGDIGNLVVTHVVKDSDWRASFEPENGNYVCSVRFQLRAQGNNTLLVYSDWYSDEKAGSVDQTLKDVEKSMKEGLARFKGLVEKSSAGNQ